MPELIRRSPEEIRKAISNGETTITQIGLGWMGLPTACLFAEQGARVIGVDISTSLVDVINKGECPIQEPGLPQLVRRHVKSGKLRATTESAEATSQGEVISIIVPTLIDRHHRADYSAVENACKEIAKGLQRDSLIIFQSTCGPGVTERIVKGTIEKYSGMYAGHDFGLSYSPIRAMGGQALHDIPFYPRILGATDERSMRSAAAVLSTITKNEILRVRDIRTAEGAKLFETIYRDVNIGLANEFALYCETAGIDYIEVMKAANSQPYSNLHVPGPGVGGHCLPVYPYLLLSEASDLRAKLRIVKKSREINDEMPRHVVRLAADGLRAGGKALRRCKATVLGITYRPNVKEIRFSPALDIIALLKRRGARVTVFDPSFRASELEAMRYESEPTMKKSIERSDLVIITVAHDEFKKIEAKQFGVSMARNGVVVDCSHVLDPSEVEEAGLIYRGVGRGLWTR